jgi:hypothetical protein
MKSTTPLRILCSSRLPDNRLNMHPNEGADLGLFMAAYSMELEEGFKAEVQLLNECPKESIEIGLRFWERLGKPAAAILSYDGEVLRIRGV